MIQALLTFTSRRRFFYSVMALLCVESLWIALTGRYPMAFDEDFHLGIIRIYAHHLSPFLAGQPAGADKFGAVARDPSYLYHYLMSFPYRLISLFTHDQTIQVIILRCLNIGLFTSALPLFRRLLVKTGASLATIHGCLLAFVLLPIVPLLAAQINYDNLLLPLVALNLLLAVRISNVLKSSRRLDLRALLGLIILAAATSLVKYAFLPIGLAIGLFLIVRLRQTFPKIQSLKQATVKGWLAITTGQRGLLLVLLVGISLLIGQRYGENVIKYHTPVPACDKVLTIQQCSNYGPWIRDYTTHKVLVNGPKNPLIFTADWFYGMWLRTFFAVDGPYTMFQTRGPLLFPALAGMIFPVAGFIGITVLLRQRAAKLPSAVWLCLAVAIAYIAVLWLDEFQSYVYAGRTVAINGRYLLPILLPLMVLGAHGYSLVFKRRPRFLVSASIAIIILLAWGGGALTYILRSNDNWYFDNQTVRNANHAVQKVLGPITPGDRKPIEFL